MTVFAQLRKMHASINNPRRAIMKCEINGVEVKGGQKWRCRNGEVRTIQSVIDSEWPIMDTLMHTYRSNGHWGHSGLCPQDLVALDESHLPFEQRAEAAFEAPPVDETNAFSLLNKAAGHMQARAATYDKPQGERSMAATVAAFNAQTGHTLSEAEGWLFMIHLKIIRDRQRDMPHRDSIEDLIAYCSLYGEARLAETK